MQKRLPMVCTPSAWTRSHSASQAARVLSNGAVLSTATLISSRASSASQHCLTRLSLMPSLPMWSTGSIVLHMARSLARCLVVIFKSSL